MKILVVEDVRAIAALMEARLASFGHDVVLAENGQVAFDRFREIQPDLVFMDIEMPLMNGFEATNRIRAFEATQKWAWTPIIFLTASDSAQNLVTAIEAGGDDYLVKGLSEDVLRAKMKAMARIAAMRQQLSMANQKLEQQASRDGLTGLFNRRWMDLNVDLAWAESLRKGSAVALLMLDVDHFKKYNDLYGHQAGDDCLRAVAHAVDGLLAETNVGGITKGAFVARYGGEEFAVVIPDALHEAYMVIAQCIVDTVGSLAIPHQHNAEWGVVTISVGGCHRAAQEGETALLFRDADLALYRAKANGRNRCELS
ncbi:MAG TPA: diguanylate cyclase [Rhodocyclaceae bacterium]